MKISLINKVNLVFVLILLPFVVGCETLAQQRAREEMRRREDKLILQEKLRNISGQVDAVVDESNQMAIQFERFEREAVSAVRSEIEPLEIRISELETQLLAQEQKRINDKQEIIDILSKKMANLVNSSRPAPRPKPRSEYGYEHTVEVGQTLSEIAAVYNVSVKVIISENNITNPNKLKVGQKLFIPE